MEYVTIEFGQSIYVRNNPFLSKEEREARNGIVRVPIKEELPSIEEFNKREMKRDLNTIIPFRCGPNNNRIELKYLSGIDETITLFLVWILERVEWLGIGCRSWYESSSWGWDETYYGPYALDDRYADIILFAFEFAFERTVKTKFRELLRTNPKKILRTDPVKILEEVKKIRRSERRKKCIM